MYVHKRSSRAVWSERDRCVAKVRGISGVFDALTKLHRPPPGQGCNIIRFDLYEEDSKIFVSIHLSASFIPMEREELSRLYFYTLKMNLSRHLS